MPYYRFAEILTSHVYSYYACDMMSKMLLLKLWMSVNRASPCSVSFVIELGGRLLSVTNCVIHLPNIPLSRAMSLRCPRAYSARKASRHVPRYSTPSVRT
jgi:hypothetical protein